VSRLSQRCVYARTYPRRRWNNLGPRTLNSTDRERESRRADCRERERKKAVTATTISAQKRDTFGVTRLFLATTTERCAQTQTPHARTHMKNISSWRGGHEMPQRATIVPIERHNNIIIIIIYIYNTRTGFSRMGFPATNRFFVLTFRLTRITRNVHLYYYVYMCSVRSMLYNMLCTGTPCSA